MRVIQTGRRDEPRLAPSTNETPTIIGRASLATSATNISTAATEECNRKATSAPSRKAVKKSRSRIEAKSGRKLLLLSGDTFVRMRPRDISINATPIITRPICLMSGVSDLRSIMPPTTSRSGASQGTSRLRNCITSAEPRSAPSVAARPNSKESTDEPKSPETRIVTAIEDCMITASTAPQNVAPIFALERIITRRNDGP